jgi:hypothetical protein
MDTNEQKALFNSNRIYGPLLDNTIFIPIKPEVDVKICYFFQISNICIPDVI